MFYLQIIIIFCGLFGTILIFKYSPIKNSQVFLYNKSELDTIKKQDKKERRIAKLGLGLVIFCFLLEIVFLIYENFNVC